MLAEGFTDPVEAGSAPCVVGAVPKATLLVLIGPSGAGKSSVARLLHQRGIITIIPTWTTRPRRRDDGCGCVEHRFVSDPVFDDLIAAGFFSAIGAMPGLPYRYGLPFLPSATHRGVPAVILRARQVGKVRPDRPVIVYQVGVEREVARVRLGRRGCRPAETEVRLAALQEELDLGSDISLRQFDSGRPVAVIADDIAAALGIDVRTDATRTGGTDE